MDEVKVKETKNEQTYKNIKKKKNNIFFKFPWSNRLIKGKQLAVLYPKEFLNNIKAMASGIPALWNH